MMFNSDENMQYKVCIYNRCSTDDEVQHNSLQIQAQQSREKCRRKGWIVVSQFVEAVSGTSTKGRTEYQKMLDEMKQDKWEVVVVKSLDRLMRNNKDWYEFLEMLARYNKKLFIYMDNKFYDTNNDSFLSSIITAMNSQFSKTLSEKLKNTHRYRQENKTGLNISREMYGWTKVSKDKYIINEEEAQYYRMALQMCLEDVGFNAISKKLYNAGARTKDGKKIAGATWRRLCLSERVYGTVVLHKTETNFELHKREKMPKEEWVYMENALPALISKESYEKIKAIVESRYKVDNNNPYAPNKYPLSGKLYCGSCGEKYHRVMSKRRNGEKVSIWKCATAYRNGRDSEKCSLICQNDNVDENRFLQLIEDISQEYIQGLFTSEDNIINKTLSLIQEELKKNSGVKKLSTLKKNLSEQKRKKEVLFEKLTDEVISDDDFKKKNKEYEEKIRAYENDIRLIEVNSDVLDINKEKLEKIKTALNNGELVKQAKGEALLDMIEKIIVYQDNTVEIHYNKYKLLGLVQLIGVKNLTDEFIATGHYTGYRDLKERTNKEKHELIKAIKRDGRKSYSEYGVEMGLSKKEIAARLKELVHRGCVKRNTNGRLVVMKEWADEW